MHHTKSGMVDLKRLNLVSTTLKTVARTANLGLLLYRQTQSGINFLFVCQQQFRLTERR